LNTFAWLGIAYLIVTVVASLLMQNPPEGWRPEGWTPTASQNSQRSRSDYTLGEALKTWQGYALWLLLFLNTFAGISIISQEAPIFQELVGVSAVVAASMVGIARIGNAFGRVFWGLGFRLDNEASNIFRDVRRPGSTLLVASERHRRPVDDVGRVCRADVLRRWIRHNAGICR
jgi:hypothetical protein